MTTENRPKPDPDISEKHRKILELVHKQKNATILVNFKGGQIISVEVHPEEVEQENKKTGG